MIDSLLSAWRVRRLSSAARAGACVLTYHGIIDRRREERLERNFHTIDVFREQVRLLRRLRVISLDELSAVLLSGTMPARGLLYAVTFDDGYENNLIAADILHAAGLPWTVFVSSGPVAEHGTIWTGELSLILLAGRIDELTVIDRVWPLPSRETRELAFQSVRSALKALPAHERLAAMQAIRAQLPDGELARLLDEYPAFRSMSWPQVRALAESGVTIGSHGVTHELHHEAQSLDVRHAELSLSKQQIESETGRTCKFFAFPNGTTNDRSSSESMAAGYELAFTTEVGAVRAGADRGALPRMQPGETLRSLLELLRGL